MQILFNSKVYKQTKFKNENELEIAVEKNSDYIFGEKTVYIDLKKRVQSKNNSFANIPDGYILDFRKEPQLWIVENELSTHDSFKHIGIQLLKFATQFTDGSYAIKEMLEEKISNTPELKAKTEKLLKKSTLNEALDYAIFKNDFGFIIVIDEITQDLINVTKELARPPEIIQFSKYTDKKHDIYLTDQLLAELNEATTKKVKETRDIDTIIAPARADGHKKAFIDQKAWWAVRISSSVIPKLKYLAMYEVAPASEIKWMGEIQSIKSYEDTGKYIIYLSKIYKIPPIKLGKPNLAPFGPRYTTYELIKNAKTLEDL